MPDFSTVEDTLFVPMLGRIYASEHFPKVLLDQKALSLKSRLPKNLKGQDTQTQYTLMASAVRSTNMDRYIRDFMKRNPTGVIVQLGCGLETTFYRNDNGRNVWYEVDLPAVIDYRRQLLGSPERDRCIAADAFGEDWIRQVRRDYPTEPILVTASGLFYYFERDTVGVLGITAAVFQVKTGNFVLIQQNVIQKSAVLGVLPSLKSQRSGSHPFIHKLNKRILVLKFIEFHLGIVINGCPVGGAEHLRKNLL